MGFVSMLHRFHHALVTRLSPFVLGRHPRNTWFSFNYHNVRHIIAFLQRAAAKMPNQQITIVDVGAGACPYYQFFAKHASRYVAIDVPDEAAESDSRAIEYLAGVAEAIPLPEATADCVLFNQVLEHVVDPDAAVSEIYRVLKPNGWFVGSVPHISPVHLEPHDYRRYTDLGLRQLLERGGFMDISIEGNGGVYSAAALLLAMDWMLSRRIEGSPQTFSMNRAFWLSPVVGAINVFGYLADTVLGDKHRSPANLCWMASKPSESCG
jgi:SAM-dependent methyltransferase